MRKYLFVLPVVMLVAAGCNSKKPAAENLPAQSLQSANATQNTSQSASTSTASSVKAAPAVLPKSQESDPNWKTNGEKTVSNFLNHIMNSNVSGNVTSAYAELTAGTQAMVKAHSPNSTEDGLSAGLKYLLNVDFLPNSGIFISDSSQVDNTTMLVVTKWDYSGQTNLLKKTFVLNHENGRWKINSIQ